MDMQTGTIIYMYNTIMKNRFILFVFLLFSVI